LNTNTSSVILNRLVQALENSPFSTINSSTGSTTSTSSTSTSGSSANHHPNEHRSFTHEIGAPLSIVTRSRAPSGQIMNIPSPLNGTATVNEHYYGTNNNNSIVNSSTTVHASMYSPTTSYLSNNISYPPSLNSSPRNSNDNVLTVPVSASVENAGSIPSYKVMDDTMTNSYKYDDINYNNTDINDQSTNNILSNIIVKISSTENRDDAAGRYTLYIITVSAGNRTWTLARRYREFRALHGALHGMNHHNNNNSNQSSNVTPILSSEKRACLPKLPPKKYLGSMSAQFIEERRKQLETYLHGVLLIPGVWAVPELVAFLEDTATGALGGHIALSRMLARVEILEAACDEAQSRFTAYEDVIASQRDNAEALKAKCAALEAALQEATINSNKGNINKPQSMNNDKTNSTIVSHDLTDDANNNTSTINSISPPFSLIAPFSTPTYSIQPIDTLHAALSRLIPRNISTLPNEVDLRLDALLVAMQPSPERERMASRINQYIASLLKRALGAQVFPIGAYPSRTYLDIDPIGLCAFLCLGQERSWFMKVSEVLFSASDANYEESIYTSSSSDDADTPFGSFLLNDDADNYLNNTDSMALAASAALSSLGYGNDGQRNSFNGVNTNRRRSSMLSSRRNSSIAEIARANLSRQYGSNDDTNNDRRLSGGVTWDNTITIRDDIDGQTSSTSTPLANENTNGVDNFIRNRYDSNVSIGSRSSARTDGGTPLCKVRSVSFLSGRVKRITAEVDASSIAITANQMAELCFVALVEDADRSIGKNHLFKRSLLLCRAWAVFDSGYHAATSTMMSALHAAYNIQRGGPHRFSNKNNFSANLSLSLSTAATAADVATQQGAILTVSALISLPWRGWVTVMLWLFIRRKNVIHHPFQAFAWLLADLSVFPWDTHALSIHGAIPLEEVATVNATADVEARIDLVNNNNSRNTVNPPPARPPRTMNMKNGTDGFVDLTSNNNPMNTFSAPLPSTTPPPPADHFQFNYFTPPVELSPSSGPTETGYHPVSRIMDSDVFHVLPENELRIYRKKCYRRRTAGIVPPAGTTTGTNTNPTNDNNVSSATFVPQLNNSQPLRVRSICILDALDQLTNTCENIGARDGARLKQVLTAATHSLHHMLVYTHTISSSISPNTSPNNSPTNNSTTNTETTLPSLSLFPLILRNNSKNGINSNDNSPVVPAVNNFESDSEGEDTLEQNTNENLLGTDSKNTNTNAEESKLVVPNAPAEPTTIVIANTDNNDNRAFNIDATTKEGATALNQVDMFFRGCWTHYLPESAITYNPNKTTTYNVFDSARYHFITRVKAMADEIAIQKLRENPSVSNNSQIPTDIANSGIFDILQGDIESVSRNLEYCSFLLDAEVTAPALLSLASEILSEKGPLPVGEIGKLLQDATSNPNLSTVLKEKFGGLKRFLEGYPNMFILGNDHPFNPHVYRIASLSKIQLANLNSGRTIDGNDIAVPRPPLAGNNNNNSMDNLGLLNGSNNNNNMNNGLNMMGNNTMDDNSNMDGNNYNGKNRRKKNANNNNNTNNNNNNRMKGNKDNTMNNNNTINNSFLTDPTSNLLSLSNDDPMGLGLSNRTNNPLDFNDILLPMNNNNSALDMASLLKFDNNNKIIDDK